MTSHTSAFGPVRFAKATPAPVLRCSWQLLFAAMESLPNWQKRQRFTPAV